MDARIVWLIIIDLIIGLGIAFLLFLVKFFWETFPKQWYRYFYLSFALLMIGAYVWDSHPRWLDYLSYLFKRDRYAHTTACVMRKVYTHRTLGFPWGTDIECEDGRRFQALYTWAYLGWLWRYEGREAIVSYLPRSNVVLNVKVRGVPIREQRTSWAKVLVTALLVVVAFRISPLGWWGRKRK